jgi:hypothetical protein
LQEEKIKEKESQILKKKLEYILEYKNKNKRYYFKDEDFLSLVNIIFILNHTYQKRGNENPIEEFFREILNLINKLEHLSKENDQNIN